MEGLENLRLSISTLPQNRARRALETALACELECLVSKVESLFYRYVVDKSAPIAELEDAYSRELASTEELFGQFLLWYFTRAENV